MRIGFVGPLTYFENHFPENWRRRADMLCLDVDEWDYSFLTRMINFRPDLTVFYRPELYPRRYLRSVPGRRIAFLSEPIQDNRHEQTAESLLRDHVYGRIDWGSYHEAIYYDATKEAEVRRRGWPVARFRPLPIDTSSFRPGGGTRPVDVAFIGKATPHRVAQLDFLRGTDLRFVWVAHGLSGRGLAALFRRSKVVLNVHADEMVSYEPRILLGAAAGCIVLSEPTGQESPHFRGRIIEFQGALDYAKVRMAITAFDRRTGAETIAPSSAALSTDRFIRELTGEPHG